MMYKEVYDLLNYSYDYLYKREVKYKPFYDYLKSIYYQSFEDKTIQMILNEWRIKELVLNGNTFNNIHVYANDDAYLNVLRCKTTHEYENKVLMVKPSILHLYYDTTFNFEEVKKIETFKFDKKYLYLYDKDILLDLKKYMTEYNYKIIYIIKDIKDVFGDKPLAYIRVTDNNISSFIEIINSISNSNTNVLYTTLSSRNILTINKYFDVINQYSNIVDINYLLGEHIGVDTKNNVYMKLNNECLYQTSKYSFKDYYIKYRYLNDKCAGCKNSILCVAHTITEKCMRRKI